jgi:hypothetical protein
MRLTSLFAVCNLPFFVIFCIFCLFLHYPKVDKPFVYSDKCFEAVSTAAVVSSMGQSEKMMINDAYICIMQHSIISYHCRIMLPVYACLCV